MSPDVELSEYFRGVSSQFAGQCPSRDPCLPQRFGGEKKVQRCGFVLADDSGVDAIFVNTSAFTGMYPAGTSYNGRNVKAHKLAGKWAFRFRGNSF